MGWKIFSHSVFLLNHNLRDALRISSPLIVMMILNFVLGGAMTIDSLEAGGAPINGTTLLLQLLTVIAGLWVAVAWHRFVLLEEQGGSLPVFHGRRMLSYFFVFLLLMIGVFLATFVAGFLLSWNTPLYILGLAAVVGLGIWIFYRLSPLLLAAALGEPMGVNQAWEATAEISGSVLAAGLLLIVFIILSFAAAVLIMFQVSILIGPLLIAVLQWAYTMVGISIVTTIYGVAVEGRDI